MDPANANFFVLLGGFNPREKKQRKNNIPNMVEQSI
jgi:hypothetical protein